MPRLYWMNCENTARASVGPVSPFCLVTKPFLPFAEPPKPAKPAPKIMHVRFSEGIILTIESQQDLEEFLQMQGARCLSNGNNRGVTKLSDLKEGVEHRLSFVNGTLKPQVEKLQNAQDGLAEGLERKIMDAIAVIFNEIQLLGVLVDQKSY